MTRILVALAAAVALAQSPAPTARTISIDFVAVDAAGMPVADLKPTELEVWIGQFQAPVKRMTVVTPEADERGGRIFVLLLDDVTYRAEYQPRVREAAKRFVSRMNPTDRAAVLTLTGTKMETTSDHQALFRAIDAYTVRATGTWQNDALGRHILDTLAAISQSLREAGDGRKTIVAIGSGWVFDRPLPAPMHGQDLLPEWIRSVRQMALSRVNLYVIVPSGVGTAPVETGKDGLARETGGLVFQNTNDANAAVERILRESSNFYIVDVPDPPVGGKADLRPLELKSLRKGVTLRARRMIPGSS